MNQSPDYIDKEASIKGAWNVIRALLGPRVTQVTSDNTLRAIPRQAFLSGRLRGINPGKLQKRVSAGKSDKLMDQLAIPLGEAKAPWRLDPRTAHPVTNLATGTLGTGAMYIGGKSLLDMHNEKNLLTADAPRREQADTSVKETKKETEEGPSLGKYVGAGAGGGALLDLLYGKLADKPDIQRTLLSTLAGGALGAGAHAYQAQKEASEECTLDNLSEACVARYGGTKEEYIGQFKEAAEFLAPIFVDLDMDIQKEASMDKEALWGALLNALRSVGPRLTAYGIANSNKPVRAALAINAARAGGVAKKAAPTVLTTGATMAPFMLMGSGGGTPEASAQDAAQTEAINALLASEHARRGQDANAALKADKRSRGLKGAAVGGVGGGALSHLYGKLSDRPDISRDLISALVGAGVGAAVNARDKKPES